MVRKNLSTLDDLFKSEDKPVLGLFLYYINLKEICFMDKNTMYIMLYHGRKSIYEELDDWGLDGPILGPYECIQTTYGHIKMSGQEMLHELYAVDSMIFYDGIYYGDWCVFTSDELSDDEKTLQQSYHEAKSLVPSLSKQPSLPVKIVVYVRGGICEDVKVNMADDDWEYAVVDYDNNPELKDDHVPYDKSQCQTVLILPKGYELAMAAKNVINNWSTGDLAESVQQLDSILNEILPPISGR